MNRVRPLPTALLAALLPVLAQAALAAPDAPVTAVSAAHLVVNPTHDPSTPMQNAEAMADLLTGAVLLRVDGFGHTSLLNRSTCANDRIATYLVDLRLPPANTWCAQDRQPFED